MHIYLLNTYLYTFPTRRSSDLSQFANIRKGGLIAVGLRDDDELISVRLTDGQKHIMIATKQGYLIRFEEEQRSEEHTSELQSRGHLVCRLLLEKKKKK